MARRKINLQNLGQSSPAEGIDDMVRGLGTTDMGFVPTDKTIYEVDLNRISPDPNQPRFLLPSDLREKINTGGLKPVDAIHELLSRAKHGSTLAKLVLGTDGESNDIDDERDEEKGLFALAASIKDVGLRQPINVYTISVPGHPGETLYRIGEGERRYWAHHLLNIQGETEYARIRCVIEEMPTDEDLVRRRQQAENAARQDLSAIARARAIEQIRDRLRISLGTRVPDQTTIKLPSQRELDEAVGQEVKVFAGRAIGGRMVRNYLRLLTLVPEIRDLAEAASLTEKQLRPVMRLSSDDDRKAMVEQIINQKLSGRAVSSILTPVTAPSTLRRTSKTTVDQRLEKRLFQAAKSVHEVLSMGDDAYASVKENLARLMNDDAVKQSLASLYQLLGDVLSEKD